MDGGEAGARSGAGGSPGPAQVGKACTTVGCCACESSKINKKEEEVN